jgi:hypothetical protein
MCKHRFGLHLLQNPPLCSSTVMIPSLSPHLELPGEEEGVDKLEVEGQLKAEGLGDGLSGLQLATG